MRPLCDPERAELNHLIKALQITGKDILEIGCGEGKFLVQYSGMAKRVIGIDPEFADLQTALGVEPGINSRFIQSIGEHLPLPTRAFDVVIFASSL